MQPRHIHISARHSPLDLRLGELWQYRDLIWLFTRRSFIVTYTQTILGPLWLFINPLLTSVTYVVLFGNIAKLSTDGVPQLLFYLSGSAMWTFFSQSLTQNASTFLSNAHLFGKVYFPRLVMPISNVLGNILRFGIQMLLVLVLLVWYGLRGMIHPSPAALLVIPCLLVLLGLMGMSLGVLISSLTTKYRDLSVLVSFAVSLWMYATPVVYPLSTVSGPLRRLLQFNPVTAPMELYRRVLLGVGSVSVGGLVYSAVFTLAAAFVGVVIFNSIERTFMDTV